MPRIHLRRACLVLLSLTCACQQEEIDDNTQLAAEQLSVASGDMFAFTEIDYKSVLPGLDIVRVNPMVARTSQRGGPAHDSGSQ